MLVTPSDGSQSQILELSPSLAHLFTKHKTSAPALCDISIWTFVKGPFYCLRTWANISTSAE